MTKAQRAEETAKRLLKGLSLNALLEEWELTTTNDDENIYTVRGWLMDEFERRNPDAYEAWIMESAEDETLRDYMTA